jgi:hypothetical protein
MSCFMRLVGAAACLAAGLIAPARAELMVGQIDTFEDGATQGWTAGGQMGSPFIPPANVSTGGPAGSDDNFLQITAVGGAGPGSKLSAFNLSQWAGDYIAAGITAIRMDVRNFGPADASLRLLLADPTGGAPSNIAITDAVFVPASGDWTSISFAVDASSLVALLGSAATALSDATELRIYHNPSPDFPEPPIGPPSVNLMLGVDNIQAVPEPASVLLMGAGLLVLIGEARISRAGSWGQRRPAQGRHDEYQVAAVDQKGLLTACCQ